MRALCLVSTHNKAVNAGGPIINYAKVAEGYYVEPLGDALPVQHNRRASDQFEYKCERVLQIIVGASEWTLPLRESRREVYAEDLARIRVALREIGV